MWEATMQPCPVCGSTGIDTAGYCVQCRTFRGQPQAPAPDAGYGYPAAGPGYAAPTSGYPAPTSGYPDPQQGGGYPPPTSGPAYGTPTSGPAYGTPTSGPAYGTPVSGPAYGTPVSGGGYPDGQNWPGQPGYPGAPLAQPTPPKSRSTLAIALIALSVVLVLIVGSIVAVAFIKSGKKSTPVAGPSTAASAEPSSKVDKCLIGTWQETSHDEDVNITDIGSVKFTGRGAEQRLKADGSGILDYKTGTSYNSTVNGKQLTVKFTGTVKFDFATGAGKVTVSNGRPSGKTVVLIDGTEYSSDDLTADEGDYNYTCTGDTLKEYSPSGTNQWQRISKNA
jgi:hypothetical protein